VFCIVYIAYGVVNCYSLIVLSCSGEIEKCDTLERQKLSAEGRMEVLTQRLSSILGLASTDAVLSSVDDITNKVYCLVLSSVFLYAVESF